jgi:hypothetical protein
MVYSSVIEGIEIKYRCPSRSELGHLSTYAKRDTWEYYEGLVKLCVIYPKIKFEEDEVAEDSVIYVTPTSSYTPGFIMSLARDIIDKTGFYNKEHLDKHLKKAEMYVTSVNGSYDALCLAVLPGMTPKLLWALEPDELYKTYMLAYRIAPAIGIDPRIFTDIEAYQKDMSNQSMQQKIAQGQQNANSILAGSMGKAKNSQIQTEDSRTFQVG